MAGSQDIEVFGDGCGGIFVVAGNHDGTDTGVSAFGDSGFDFGTDGVDHAAHTDPGQVLFKRSRIIGGGSFVVSALGSAEDAQGLIGHGLVFIEDMFPVVFGDGNGLAIFPDMGTAAQDFIRRTFGKLNEPGFALMNRGHHLAQ